MAVIRDLRRDGVAMAYISHRMAEVFTLGDRVTVLRNDKRIASMPEGQATADELVTLMVGHQVDMSYRRDDRPAPGARNGIRDVSLHVRVGEIVGLAGLVGSGRTEVERAIFGADPVTSGTIRIDDRVHRGGPAQARGHGLGLIPENRKQQSLALSRTVGDNQQKVVIGKWLLAGMRIDLFDEPTRGIDVSAKEEIFRLIDQLVKDGCAVLMISAELSEIVRVWDRAYMMKEKRIAGELSQDDLSETNLLRLAMHHE